MTTHELGLVVEPLDGGRGHLDRRRCRATLEVGSFMNTIGCSGGSVPVSAACAA